MSDIEARLKALEDWQQALARTFLAPPTITTCEVRPVKSPAQLANENTTNQNIDNVRMSFPEEIESKFTFTENSDYIILKSKVFLGSETFAKVASAVRGMGGEYISAGKNSHFRISKARVSK